MRMCGRGRHPLAIFILVGFLLILFSDLSFAQASGGSEVVQLKTIATNVAKTVVSLAKMLQAIGLIAGIGFIMAAFFKFHQHKLNPTQVSLSQGVTLLLIGAGLTLFPVLIPTAGSTILGKSAEVAHVSGSAIKGIIGGSGYS